MKKRGKNLLANGLSVADRARILRSKAAWNPQHFSHQHDLAQELEQLQLEVRLQQQQDQACCPECKKIQTDSGDDQALCRHHFALVLGFEK